MAEFRLGHIKCPCGGDTRVINSGVKRQIVGFVRTRQCKSCGVKITTTENIVSVHHD
jgi:transcriptional regulator NrdR family protein